MKRLIPALSLAVVAAISMPADAQTLTRVNRSSVFNRAQSSRAASVQRSQQQALKRTKVNQARAARTRQSRALQQAKRAQKLGARTTSSNTIVGTRREVAAQRRRAERQRLSKLPDRGNTRIRVIKRRLATDEEARTNRVKPVIR